MKKRLPLLFGAYLIISTSLLSCKKEEPNDEHYDPYAQSTGNLSPGNWIMFKYSDTNNDSLTNDTLHFIDQYNLTWNDSASTYRYWTDGHGGKGLSFNHTPFSGNMSFYNMWPNPPSAGDTFSITRPGRTFWFYKY